SIRMITLQVPDMSCSHCAGVITKAIKALDPQATVGFDMHHHQVQVDTRHDKDAVLKAVAAAGYPAKLA
ncbi:MAG: heavy-metal-associated domain-containing protein, partial [Massilia sp.]